MHSAGNCIFVGSPSWSTIPLYFSLLGGRSEAVPHRHRGPLASSLQAAPARESSLSMSEPKGEDAALFSVVVGPAGTVLAIEAHPVTLG